MLKHKNFTAVVISIIIIVAVFLSSCAPKYQLNIIETDGGSVSMTPTGLAFSAGTLLELDAKSDSTHVFTGWGGISGYSEDYSMSSKIKIDMPADNIEISANFAVPNEGWTFMIYMSGDQTGTNSLSPYVSYDLNEIEKGLYDAVNSGNTQIDSVVRVLVLADRSGDDDTSLYLVKPDDTSEVVSPKLRIEFNSDGELNMGNPETLKDFTSFCLGNYPSVYNALILWNHGGGVKSFDFDTTTTREICSDETDDDILYLNEVQTALSSALGGSKLDIIGMDACIMGEVETAYEMRKAADYFVASAANELGAGWGYDYIFDKFTSAGNPPEPAEMADILVTQYKNSASLISHADPDTMVAVKTSELENLKTQIDKLAELVYIDGDNAQDAFQDCRDASVYYFDYVSSDDQSRLYNPYHDIFSFCSEIEGSEDFSEDVIAQASAVKAALSSSVAAAYGNSVKFDAYHTSWPDLDLDYYETSDTDAVRGLSILIPHGDETDDDGYSYYSSVFWYTSDSVTAGYAGSSETFLMGGLDFCTYDSNDDVNTWYELFDAWYE